MEDRIIGTISMGLRAPIIKEGSNIEKILTDTVLGAASAGEFVIDDRDIIAVTESVVARAQGNYATTDQLAADIKNKFGGEDIGELRFYAYRPPYFTLFAPNNSFISNKKSPVMATFIFLFALNIFFELLYISTGVSPEYFNRIRTKIGRAHV